MKHFLRTALDWSEVWATVIPITMLFFGKKQPAYLKSVIIYLFIAFSINLLGDVLVDYGGGFILPLWLQRNTFLYNAHSIVRFACFTTFFIRLEQPLSALLKKVVPVLSVLFVLINFSFFENFNDENHFSGRLLTTEAFLLLLYCRQYYLYRLREEEIVPEREPHFWVATGLSIYVVINFFIFLFYIPMLRINPPLAEKMWDYHNIAYIIFCLFLAKAFYVPARN